LKKFEVVNGLIPTPTLQVDIIGELQLIPDKSILTITSALPKCLCYELVEVDLLLGRSSQIPTTLEPEYD